MSDSATESPEQIIARIASKAERRLTPCGDGHLVSHVWGDGPPLVLLHGHFGSWTHWIRNIEVLAKRYRVIAIDIPGFGDSAMPPEPPAFDSMAEIVAAGIVDIAGDEKVGLAGFSFGAALASATAHVLGPRLRELVMVSAGSNMADITMHGTEKFVNWKGLDTQAERDAAHRRNLGIIMIADPARIDDLAVAIQGSNVERARLRVPIWKPGTTQTWVPGLKAPVSFIWAALDARIGPDMEQRTAWIRRYRPDARYIIIPDAGHWVAYEQPEAFNAALLELLLKPSS